MQQQRHCGNCSTTATPRWLPHPHDESQDLCNACYLYWSTHGGEMRPEALWARPHSASEAGQAPAAGAEAAPAPAAAAAAAERARPDLWSAFLEAKKDQPPPSPLQLAPGVELFDDACEEEEGDGGGGGPAAAAAAAAEGTPEPAPVQQGARAAPATAAGLGHGSSPPPPARPSGPLLAGTAAEPAQRAGSAAPALASRQLSGQQGSGGVVAGASLARAFLIRDRAKRLEAVERLMLGG